MTALDEMIFPADCRPIYFYPPHGADGRGPQGFAAVAQWQSGGLTAAASTAEKFNRRDSTTGRTEKRSGAGSNPARCFDPIWRIDCMLAQWACTTRVPAVCRKTAALAKAVAESPPSGSETTRHD